MQKGDLDPAKAHEESEENIALMAEKIRN